MDFAADAVLDLAAPPARPAPARAPAVASEEPTFDDHLQAAVGESETPPEPEVLPAPEQPLVEAAADASDPALSLLGGEILPVAPPAQPALHTTAAPVLLQFITSMVAPAHDTSAKPQTLTPSAPTQPPPVTPAMTPTPAAPDAQGAAPAAGENAPAAAPSSGKNIAPAEKSAAPTQTPQPLQTPPAPVQAQQTAQAVPFPILATTTDQPAPSAEAAQMAPVGPLQTQPTPELATRQPKAAPQQGEAKLDAAPPQDRAAAAPTAPPRANAKAVTQQNTTKDAIAFAALDAPETAPAQPTSASTTPAAAAASTHAQHAVAEDSVARAAPAPQQVAREIVRRFDGGATRFELRLDPPELGRVEVKLEVSRDHRVTAVIAADSPQALTELARHARELEQMLQGAGLELGDNGLSFDLRQGGERMTEASEDGASRAGGDASAQKEDIAPVAARPIGYERWRGVRVDVTV